MSAPSQPDGVKSVQRSTTDDSAGHLASVPVEPAGGEQRYRALRLHAQGGLGEVHVAEDAELHREVALKRIQQRHAGDAESRRRFLLEAEITGRLEHPGIVPVYGLVHDEGGEPCYAMRFIEGESLKDAVARFHQAEQPRTASAERRLAFRQLLSCFVTVCNTLAYAHSRGIVHRDLKPSNIMLGKYGETLVVDWGLAKPFSRGEMERSTGEETLAPVPAGAGDSDTQQGQALGTPAYMSPEQAAGQWDVLGPASDIYSLGATLYTLLTGKAPFQANSKEEIVRKARAGDFRPPRQLRRDIPAALEAICLKAMAPRPEQRYGRALDLAADVEHWLADEPVAAYREPLRTRLGRWGRRHQAILASAAALVLTAVTALVIGIILLDQKRREAETARRQANDSATEAKRQEGIAKDNATKANQEKENADNNYKRAEETFQLAKNALDICLKKLSAEPRFQEGEFEKMRVTLLEVQRHFYQAFVKQRGEEPKFKGQRASAFFYLGFVTAELASQKEAIPIYEQARSLSAELVRDYPNNPEYQRNLATCLNNLGSSYQATRRFHEAEQAHEQALKIQQELADKNPGVEEYQADLAASHHNLGGLYHATSRHKQAEQAYQKDLAILKDLTATNPTLRDYRAKVANSHMSLGGLYRDTGRLEEAEQAHKDALAIQKELADQYPIVVGYAISVGGSQCNLGHVAKDRAQYEAALGWYAQAIATLDRVLAKYPLRLTARKFLRNTYEGRAEALTNLGRYSEALKDCDRALEFDDGLHHHQIHLFHASILARLKEHTRATAVADTVAGAKDASADNLYDAACVYALSAAATRDDAKQAEQYAARAVELLRQALSKGFKHIEHMKKDSDLDALRQREDFKKLLRELEAKK
jgi:serine/threonine-protein kinase